jgi:magnesium-transporting ATPase (P-type)
MPPDAIRKAPSEVHKTGEPWHAMAADEVLARIEASTDGLTQEEAQRRLGEYGPNRLPETASRGPLMRLLAQFNSLLIYVLLAAAVLAALIDHYIDALVILAVVIVNAVIGFIQEGRAEQALDAIRTMIDPRASVLRGAQRETVPAEEIVPGDLVILEAGDRVPADLRLIRARNLRIDEAILTGESVAVEKALDPVDAGAGLGDRLSIAYSGTFVAAGHATGVVVATGAATELGRISTLIGSVERLQTPLIRQINALARVLTFIILAISAAIFALAYGGRGYELPDAFMIVVGLAVAAIPEGLPAVITITLAIGVQRMAARKAIIRRLPAVEALGSVSVICSDKTGTLTRNEMMARTVLGERRHVEVTGEGYAPRGSFLSDGIRDRTRRSPHLGRAHPLRGAVQRCRTAPEGRHLDRRRRSHGRRAHLAGPEGGRGSGAPQQGSAAHRRDPVRRRAPLHGHPPPQPWRGRLRVPQGRTGAHRGHVQPADEQRRHRRYRSGLLARADRRPGRPGPAGAGVRHQADGPGHQTLTFADVEEGATLLGLVGLIDPPREEAIAAVGECHTAGIRVIMITGDHAATAGAIARQLGLAEDPKVVTGQALEALDAAQLQDLVRERRSLPAPVPSTSCAWWRRCRPPAPSWR